jgi:DNA (cytosine-5)-methyltransferase 1
MSRSAQKSWKVVDLFAGCGGLTQGLRDAAADAGVDLQVVVAVEFDLPAAATYAANHGSHVFYGKIEDWVMLKDLPAADLIVGGPPCQGFSGLGKQDPNDPRNKLWKSYIKAVQRIQPRYFIMENVPQFKKSKEYAKLLKETRPKGALAGYELQDFVVNAHDHGTAQKRRRAIIVGRRQGEAPVQIPLPSKQISLRKALKGLSPAAPTHDTWVRKYSSFIGVMLSGSVGLSLGRTTRLDGPYTGIAELHIQGPMSEQIREMVRNIPAGGDRYDLPEELQYDCWKRGTYNGSDVMGRLSWEKPSVTIRTQFYKPDKGRYIHPTEDRTITYAEAARIQGFPDDYVWYGSPTNIAKQIGNAVPVPLGKMLGLAVFTAQSSTNPTPTKSRSTKLSSGKKKTSGPRGVSSPKKKRPSKQKVRRSGRSR